VVAELMVDGFAAPAIRETASASASAVAGVAAFGRRDLQGA